MRPRLAQHLRSKIPQQQNLGVLNGVGDMLERCCVVNPCHVGKSLEPGGRRTVRCGDYRQHAAASSLLRPSRHSRPPVGIYPVFRPTHRHSCARGPITMKTLNSLAVTTY